MDNSDEVQLIGLLDILQRLESKEPFEKVWNSLTVLTAFFYFFNRDEGLVFLYWSSLGKVLCENKIPQDLLELLSWYGFFMSMKKLSGNALNLQS